MPHEARKGVAINTYNNKAVKSFFIVDKIDVGESVPYSDYTEGGHLVDAKYYTYIQLKKILRVYVNNSYCLSKDYLCLVQKLSCHCYLRFLKGRRHQKMIQTNKSLKAS